MGRCLTTEHVTPLADGLPAYDAELKCKTGLSLLGIAAKAMEVTEDEARECIGRQRAAAVSITAGGGELTSFSRTVRDILAYLGADAFTTTATDVAGIREAIDNRANIIFMADDVRFIALNIQTATLAENVDDTARGYATALAFMAGGLEGRRVLVIGGGGRVGRSAASFLKAKGAEVAVYDTHAEAVARAAEEEGVTLERDLGRALDSHRLLFDASNAADVISAEHITKDMFIAAPGMPLGLSREARSIAAEHLVHDVLEIGIATMLVHASCISH